MFYYVLFGRKHSRRTTNQNSKGTKFSFESEKTKPNGRTGRIRPVRPAGRIRLVRPARRTAVPSGQTRQTESFKFYNFINFV